MDFTRKELRTIISNKDDKIRNLEVEIEKLQEGIKFFQEQDLQIKQLESQMDIGKGFHSKNGTNFVPTTYINLAEKPEDYEKMSTIFYEQLNNIKMGVTRLLYWPNQKKLGLCHFILFVDPPNDAEYMFRIVGIEKTVYPKYIEFGDWCMVCSQNF